MQKTRRKALKSLLQEKVVNIADYRTLKTGRGPRRLALVTTDAVLASALEELLKSNVEVHKFDSRFSLEQGLKNSEWDGVILDERTLRDDTLSLCEKLKRQNKMEELVVLILSANVTKEVVKEGFEKGCDEWVTKFDDANYLARLVQQHLN